MINEAAKKVGLQNINRGKTEYTMMKRKDCTRMCSSLRVGNHEFSRVKLFKYLDSILTKKKMKFRRKWQQESRRETNVSTVSQKYWGHGSCQGR